MADLEASSSLPDATDQKTPDGERLVSGWPRSRGETSSPGAEDDERVSFVASEERTRSELPLVSSRSLSGQRPESNYELRKWDGCLRGNRDSSLVARCRRNGKRRSCDRDCLAPSGNERHV